MLASIASRRPSRSMVVASLALTVALGGTSYAAIKLPANSVGAKQIRTNAVTGAKVKDFSLSASDFAAGQLPKGPAGANGANGPAGPAGASGAPGPAGSAQAYGLVSSAGAVDASRSKGITATRLAVGLYCVTAPGVSNTTRVPVATPVHGVGTIFTMEFVDGQPGCPGGWVFVGKAPPNDNTNTDMGFSIVIP